MKRPVRHSPLLLSIALGFWTIGAAPVSADVYVLSNDGEVRGELVNNDESPRQKFVIRTPDGATVTLDRAQVKQIIPQSPAELEFEKTRPTYPDTVDDQWRLAEWCRENSLPRQRQAVLEHVIDLNPDYRPARLALGYQQIDGRWLQKEQIMQEQGFMRYKGEWRLPQEIELIERRQHQDAAERQWVNNLKRWRAGLEDPSRADQAREGIRGINEPPAVPALEQALNSERNREVRMLYVQALARIGTPAAVRGLVDHSLDDPDEEIRVACLDQLTGKPQPDAVGIYVAALKSQDNARINRAAYALGKLGDKSVIGPLIDSLITTHKFVEGSGNPNSINAGFSPQGGGGLSVGSSTKVVHRPLPNQKVLDALVALTGGVNLNFDQKAWKNWFASQQKQSTIDVRRD